MGVTSGIVSYIGGSPRDMGAYADLVQSVRQDAADGTISHAVDATAIAVVSDAIRGGWADARQLSVLGSHLRDLLTLDAPLDFDSFAQAMEFDRDPASRLWLPRRRCLWRLCEELNWLEFDPGAELLSISMPPRTGKSSVAGLWMAFHMGRNPKPSNLMTAHSDKLTKHFYTQELQYVRDPEYRFSEIFPDAPVVWESAEDEAFSLAKHTAYPTCTCRSVGGTLTGAVEVSEGGILYSDDLVKDLEEAMSPRRLDAKWEAYVNQCYDRRKRGSRQLMIGTRWDVNDPIGRMTRLHEGEPGYHVLAIPALDPSTGESNFDYMYGVGFDRHYYVDMARTTDHATYAAKYDGRPEVREGQLYSPDQLERYVSLPDGEPSRVVAVVDTKGVGSDYAAMPVAAQWAGSPKWFVIDAICDNGNPDVVNRRIANCIEANGVQQVRFESNNAGAGVANDVAEMLRGDGCLCAVQKKWTSSNKQTRILAASPWVISNLVFRDPDAYGTGDYATFMSQVTGYVMDGKNPHDDAPDSLSMLADLLGTRTRAKARAVARPF